MVVAFELEELVAAGVDAGQAEGGVHGLGAGEPQPQQLGTGQQPLERLGQFQLHQVLAGIQLPFAAGCCDPRQHVRMGVAQDQRPLAEREIEVVVAVGIDDVAAGAADVE